MWELGEDSATVASANEEYEGAEISNLMEIRTKLKFVGNKKRPPKSRHGAH